MYFYVKKDNRALKNYISLNKFDPKLPGYKRVNFEKYTISQWIDEHAVINRLTDNSF